MNSIKHDIIKYLELHSGWQYGGQLEDHIRQLKGAKASNASRRCRELVESGALEVRYVQIDGIGPHVVQYRLKPVFKVDRVTSNLMMFAQ